MRKETLNINGKELKILKLKINLLENNEDFLNLFDKELKKHIFETSKNKPYVALRKLWFKNIFSFQDFKKIYQKEGYIKIFNGNAFIFKTVEIEKYFKGTMRGKVRPKHSKFMSLKMKGIDRGDEFRRIKNEQNKSIEFKIKVLKNKFKNISLENMSDEEIFLLYSEYMSKNVKSEAYRINKIKKFLESKKYVNEIIFNNFCEKYEDEIINNSNYQDIFREMMSIISSITISKNNNMGSTKFFLKGLIEVKNCINRTILSYRSSWELKTIEFLEKNEIKYHYEPFYIQKESKGYYIPDFLIELNENKILLEIKGFIRGKSGKLNEEEKIKAALNYCNEQNLKYVYLKKPLTKIEELYGN